MADAVGFTVFDTAIGWCGIAWGAQGIAGVQLPASDERATRIRMRRKHHGADEATPPADVQRAIDGIVALLSGTPIDFAGVTLDMEGVPEFHRRVYDVAQTIRAGRPNDVRNSDLTWLSGNCIARVPSAKPGNLDGTPVT